MRRPLFAAATTAALCLAASVAATAPARADASPGPNPSGSADTSTLLDPTSDSALLNLLGQQGVTYYPITSASEAVDYADATVDATLVISEDERPSAADLSQLHSVGFGRVVILNDDASTVSSFLLNASVAGYTDNLTAPVQPGCTMTDPQAAGSVDFHTESATFTTGGTNEVAGCYPVGGAPTLIYQSYGGADAVAVGSTTFFENDEQIGRASCRERV